jgi:hypothetical protein
VVERERRGEKGGKRRKNSYTKGERVSAAAAFILNYPKIAIALKTHL